MYGKIFESIFDSTLAAEGGWMPTYIFMSMVVLADQDGVVDVAPKALYRRLGFSDYDSKIEYGDFTAALEYLQREDSSSRSPEKNGKRIIPLSEMNEVVGNRGFVIVNYAYYRDKGSRDDRARQSTARSKKFRGKHNKNKGETQGDAKQRKGRYTDTDTDTDTGKKGARKLAASDRKNIDGLNLEAWDLWLAYRRKTKQRPYTTDMKAMELAALSLDEQLECVNHSISNEYTGLFPDKFCRSVRAAAGSYNDKIRSAVDADDT